MFAFGIVVPLPEFLAGMVICIGAAMAMLSISEPGTRISERLTVALAVLFGVLAANFHSAIYPHWNLNLVMAVAGAGSRIIPLAFEAFGKGLIERARKLPHDIRLPWEK